MAWKGPFVLVELFGDLQRKCTRHICHPRIYSGNISVQQDTDSARTSHYWTRTTCSVIVRQNIDWQCLRSDSSSVYPSETIVLRCRWGLWIIIASCVLIIIPSLLTQSFKAMLMHFDHCWTDSKVQDAWLVGNFRVSHFQGCIRSQVEDQGKNR